MALVLDWKKKLGYTRDPFELVMRPPVGKCVTALDEQKERFNLFLIREERYGTISGDRGTGKTTFLAWMWEQLGGRVEAHYLDASRTGKLLDALLEDTTSALMRKLRGTMKKSAEEKRQALMKKLGKKRHVLLIDNAGGLPRESQELLHDIMDRTATHVLCADTRDRLEKLELPPDKLGLRTPDYTQAQLADILRKRIEAAGGVGTFPFDEKQVQQLVKHAAGNPAKLLGFARERAIELSLKVTTPPKRVGSANQTGEEKRIGFLNIRIDKGEQPPEVVIEEPQAEHHAATQPETSPNDDIHLLAEIVRHEPEESEQKPAVHDQAKMDAMIRKLAAPKRQKKRKR